MRVPVREGGALGAPRRVLLVRDWDAQAAGSGCCSGPVGPLTEPPGREDCRSAHAGRPRQGTGPLYLALREAFPQADVTVVDGRNWAWLLPAVVRDARRSGASYGDALRQAARATAPGSLVVDGRVLGSGRVPGPEEGVRMVAASASGRRG